MPDYKGFTGREFHEGNFRDVGGGPAGGNASYSAAPQRKKPDMKKWSGRILIVLLILILNQKRDYRLRQVM